MAWEMVLGCVAAVCAFASALLLGMEAERRAERNRAASEATGAKGGRIAWRIRNGFACAKPLARFALRFGRVSSFADDVVRFGTAAGWATAPEAALSLLMVLLSAVALGGALLAAAPLFGLAASALCLGCLVAAMHTAKERHSAALRDEVPDALRSMGVCFGAGLSLMQTFQQVAKEMREPMKGAFLKAAHMLETGRSAKEALSTFGKEAAVPEMAFVAAALDVQHQTGGSMGRVLDAARDAVESELDLARSLRAQTAQAKLSARIVSVMPFALIALFSLVSEDFLAPFFSSFEGLVLLAAALSMQVIGVLAVRRTLQVERDAR